MGLILEVPVCPAPDNQTWAEARVSSEALSILEAVALTLSKLEAEALITKPKPKLDTKKSWLHEVEAGFGPCLLTIHYIPVDKILIATLYR